MPVIAPFIVPRTSKADMGSKAPVFLDLWTFFNLISNTILLPILVGTFILSRRVKRHPVLINVCVTWIFSGVFSLLLFYTDTEPNPHQPDGHDSQQQDQRHHPSTSLCTAQTSLLQGIHPMWSVATLILVYHITATLRRGRFGLDWKYGRIKMCLMLAAPYVTELIFTVITLSIAIAHPELVNKRRRFFYCSFDSVAIAYSASIFTFLVCLCILLLELNLAVLVFRHWSVLRRQGQEMTVEASIIVRILAFGIIVLYGTVANVMLMFDEKSVAPDLFAAIAGTVIFLVFGIHADVIRAWCFWLPEPEPPPPQSSLVAPFPPVRPTSTSNAPAPTNREMSTRGSSVPVSEPPPAAVRPNRRSSFLRQEPAREVLRPVRRDSVLHHGSRSSAFTGT